MNSFQDINSLSTLLQDSRDAETVAAKGNTHTQHQPPMALGTTLVRMGAGGGGGADRAGGAAAAGVETGARKQDAKATKSIWAMEDIPTEDALACGTIDDRPCPRYEISYKQAVGTEDTFLGLGDKSPASADCTHITIKIHFPGSSMKDLDLDVTKSRIKAESKTHRLFTYLPVTVDKDKGNAKFDKAKEVLTVTLPIVPDE